ncbi:MAG: type II toxin-antitoxin system RelE/ParE family toxin [Hyphomicrobiales bacterium]|nr:type II toxin-antitoxin system RelE/ParE family toxin [Nitratireductor sp.]MCC2097993.1 type II toxin-antitoxin system RelE/ParE family toxin [Hyphomicrobiales bacterium]
MRRRVAEFSEEARADLFALYDRIADAAGPQVAFGYVSRLEEYCRGFDIASERGHLREDIRPGLRIVGFERRVTIAFAVTDKRVIILRLFHGGQNWTELDWTAKD